jgi:cytoskeletal protein CcmA (bactofilin family)
MDINKTPSDIQNHSSANDVYLGEGVIFKGTMVVPNRAVIAGTFDGELDAQSVLIKAAGKMSGRTEAVDLDVHGELAEKVRSKNLLTIRQTGRVDGTLTYADIEIEKGGQFVGVMQQLS